MVDGLSYDVEKGQCFAIVGALPVIRLIRSNHIADDPSPINLPTRCHFHPYCRLAKDTCREAEPELIDIGNDHGVDCHMVK